MVKIVLDPGHGGTANLGGSSWNNAKGPNGLLEKTVTLKVALAAKEALSNLPVQVLLTRSTDVNVGIRARAAVAKDNAAEVFVSIHFNAPETCAAPAQGTETWINPNPREKSRMLASKIQASVLAVTGYRDRGVKDSILVSGVLRNDYHHQTTAHCLVEISFLSCQSSEEARLKTDAYISELGQAIRSGIVRYCVSAGLLPQSTQEALTEGVDDTFGEPEDAASAYRLGLIPTDEEPVAAGQAFTEGTFTESTDPRLRMAKIIVDFEARRDSRGRIEVYYPPAADGGGRFEVAGINVRYHPDQAWALRRLIEAGRHAEAEALAADYIAQYTDVAMSWCRTPGVQFFLRDSVFNRGPGGGARILQRAVGVAIDGVIGARTRAAVAAAENNPRDLIASLRRAREDYEREEIGYRPIFWAGLVNRWNKAQTAALTFLNSSPVATEAFDHSDLDSSYPPFGLRAEKGLTDDVLERFPDNAIIGVHAAWEIEEIQRILDFPGKNFKVAWFSEPKLESPVGEETKRASRSVRIRRAALTQENLVKTYGPERFAGHVALSVTQEKTANSPKGKGTQSTSSSRTRGK